MADEQGVLPEEYSLSLRLRITYHRSGAAPEKLRIVETFFQSWDGDERRFRVHTYDDLPGVYQLLKYQRQYLKKMLAQRLLAALTLAIEEADVVAWGEEHPGLDKIGVREVAESLREHAKHPYGSFLEELERVDKRGHKERKADLSGLRDEFERLSPLWREASTLYKAANTSSSEGRRQSWRGDIARDYAELSQHPDLLERLQPAHNWPVDIADKCVEQGGEDKPDDIALEHAARCCGAEAYAYKLTSLKKYLRKKEFQK